MLYNIDPINDQRHGPGGAIRLGPFKLIRGDPGRPDGWIPPYNVVNEDEEMLQGRNNTMLEQQLLLFNLEEDPCEKTNLISSYPAITGYLSSLLDTYQAGMVQPDLGEMDPRG